MIGICGLLLGNCGKSETPGGEPSLPGTTPVSAELQQQIGRLNAGLATLRSLIGAISRTELASLQEAAGETHLRFRDGTELTVACDASAAGAPLIGVAADGDAYYWMWRGDEKPRPLMDAAGKRLSVSGGQPSVGVDGEGFWTLATEGGTPWRVVDEAGTPLRAAEKVQTALFRSITAQKGNVEFLLTDGTRLSVAQVTDLSAAGRANCYIVPAAGRYSFDAGVRGNGVGDVATAGFDPKIELTDGMKALWLWSDREGLVSEVELDPKSGEILFTAGGERGNAVVALMRDGVVVWSWHLWMTEPPQTVSGGSGALFMDRNLGARGATVGGSDAYGMYYQWGRKEPFYGGEATETSATAFAEAKRLTVVNPEVAAEWKIDKRAVTAAEAAAMPMTFFSAKLAAGTYDWLSTPIAGLWGAAKTLNDPCPPGYKVPEVTAWEGIAVGNNYVEGVSAWDDPNFGLMVTSEGGAVWYPAQGYRFHSSGNIAGLRASTGGSGSYWSSTATARSARYLFFRRPLTTSGGSINLSLDKDRAAGYTVRCCRE